VSKIVVHHLEKSRSHRVLWLLAELGVEYELETYPRNPKTLRAPKELRKIHPLGKAPVVVLDDQVLAESGAIVETLIDRFDDGTLRPAADSTDLLRYRYWLHYAEGSMMAPLLVRLITSRIRSAPLPFFIKPIAKKIAGTVDETFTNPEIERHLEFVDGALEKHDWFSGSSFGGADIQMSYPLAAASERGGLGDRKHIEAWLERIRARPAYVAAEKAGGAGMVPDAA
jgi:glutathione S-transferase